MKHVDAMSQFIHSEIEKHRETYDSENMRDLVDLYIQAEKNDFKDMKGMDGRINLWSVFWRTRNDGTISFGLCSK